MTIYEKFDNICDQISNELKNDKLDCKKLRKLYEKKIALASKIVVIEGQKIINQIPVEKGKGKKTVSVVKKIINEMKKLIKADKGLHPDVRIAYKLAEKLIELTTYKQAARACRDIGISTGTRSNLTQFYNNIDFTGLERILDHAKATDVKLYRTFFFALNEAKFRSKRAYTNFAITRINNGETTAKKVHDAIVLRGLHCASAAEQACCVAENARVAVNTLTTEAVELGTVRDMN